MPEIERRDLVKEKEELTLSIVTSLLQLAQEDKLSSLLSIRKGKVGHQQIEKVEILILQKLYNL